MRDAITAAREGDKDRARTLFEEIVERDDKNEKAWFWLASLAEEDETRIIYLNNVLAINPANERAQSILTSLETRQKKAAKSALDEEVIPGVSRRVVIYGGAGLAILVVLICAALAVIISNNNRIAQEQASTAAALQATIDAREQEAATAAAAATQAAILADFTPTPLGATLPPSWTPPPSATSSILATATPLATAIGSGMFQGKLLVAEGNDTTGTGFVPLVEIPLDGLPPRQFFNERAANPNLSPLGDMMVYTRYSAGTGEQGLELAWTDGSRSAQLLSTLLGGRILQKQDDGSFSPDNTVLAFSAREPGSVNSDIYVIPLQALTSPPQPDGADGETTAAQALQRLTNGRASNTAPSWGDSSRLLFVEDSTATGGGVDIKIITTTGQITALTTDGNAMIEGNPDLSPDGQLVAFQAHSPANPENNNIYIVAAGGGMALLIVDSPGNDVRPRWSPDGRFLVYSSNRGGSNYEVYIVDVSTYANYQVTFNTLYSMANQWVP